MTKSSKGFVHLVLIIAVFLVGIVGVGYFAFTQKHVSKSCGGWTFNNIKCPLGMICKKEEVDMDLPDASGTCQWPWTTSSHSTTPPLPVNTSVNTSDWKTYRNEDYRFEISYPPDWYIEETENFGESQYTFYVRPESPSTNRQVYLTVSILRNNVAEYSFGVCCKEKDRTVERIGSNDFYTSNSSILDGMIEWNYQTGDGTLFAKFNLGIGKRDDPPPLPKVDQVKKELDDFHKILSTFKFTE